MANKIKGISFIAAGAGVGAVVALLYAPRTGKQTRARIRKSANHTLHRAAEIGEDMRAYVASGIGTCKQTAEAGGERIKQTLGKVREEIDKGRERVVKYVRSA